nr:MAG TPA: hypothetical protein [Caudoviricetes sp.]
MSYLSFIMLFLVHNYNLHLLQKVHLLILILSNTLDLQKNLYLYYFSKVDEYQQTHIMDFLVFQFLHKVLNQLH